MGNAAVVALLLEDEPSAPGLSYDWSVPIAQQNEAWTCSVYAGDWCLRSLGIPSDDETLEKEMLQAGVVTVQYGLMDARGYGLATILAGQLPDDVEVEVHESLDWDWLLRLAGKGPLALGGRRWGPGGHWVAVRGVHGDMLTLANSAHGHAGVGQYLTRGDFHVLGPWSAVRIPVGHTTST